MADNTLALIEQNFFQMVGGKDSLRLTLGVNKFNFFKCLYDTNDGRGFYYLEFFLPRRNSFDLVRRKIRVEFYVFEWPRGSGSLRGTVESVSIYTGSNPFWRPEIKRKFIFQFAHLDSFFLNTSPHRLL